MTTAWIVGINLMTRSNFGLVAGNIARQSAQAEASVDGLKRKMTTSGRAAGVAKGAFVGIGVAAAATFAIGLKGASDLQQATTQAAAAMGRMGSTIAETKENMRGFRDLAFEMSKMTGQSISNSMDVVSTMASAGLTESQIKNSYRSIAQFTDVLHFNKKDHMEFSHAAALGAGLAHDFQLFNEKDMQYGLARVAQMGYMSPHGTEQLGTQARRMAGMLMNALPGTNRQKADEIIKLTAWSDRMGNLPFAGAAISQMLTQMIHPRSMRVAESMHTLGLLDGHYVTSKRGKRKFVEDRNVYFDEKTGEYNLMGALFRVQKTLADARARKQAGPAIQAMFGTTQNMQKIMGALTSKAALEQYKRITEQQEKMGKDPVKWLDDMQTQLMGQLAQKTSVLTSNFQTLSTLLVDQFIPPLTTLVGRLADITGNAAGFVKDHPTAAKAGGIALVGAGALGALLLGRSGLRLFAGLTRGHHGFHAFGGGVLHSARHGGFSKIIPAAEKGAGRIGGELLDFLTMGPLRRTVPKIVSVLSAVRSSLFKFRGPANPGFMRDMALGLRGIPGVRSLGVVFSHLNGLAKFAAGGVNILARMLPFLGGGLLKLGMKAIPVVGNVLMLIDAIKFLGAHAKDIGSGLAYAVDWIKTNGIPLVVNAFKSLMSGIAKFIGDSVSGIVGVLTGKGGGKGGIFGVVGWLQGIGDQYNKKLLNIQHERKVADAKTHAAAAPAKIKQHANVGGHRQVAMNLTVNYHEAEGSGDSAEAKRRRNEKIRDMTASVFKEASNVMRTASRAAAGSVQLVGMSPSEVSNSAFA